MLREASNVLYVNRRTVPIVRSVRTHFWCADVGVTRVKIFLPQQLVVLAHENSYDCFGGGERITELPLIVPVTANST